MLLPDPFILGLHGRAGAGKDTAAAYLVQHYGFHRYGFADPLRDMILALLDTCGIDHAWVTEPHLKEQPIPGLGHSYRELAQGLGTDWARKQLGDSFWLRAAEAALGISADNLPGHQAVHDRIVISDVRFENEAAWVTSLHGVVVGLMRAEAPPVRDHVSERFNHPGCAGHLRNDGSIADLHNSLDGLMELYGIARRAPTPHALGPAFAG